MRVPSPALLILAAGLGRRYGGLKQFDPMGASGESLLDYSIFDARKAGFDRVVLVVAADLDSRFRSDLLERFDDHIELDFVVQDLHDLPVGFQLPAGRTQPWGTAHAVLAAREALNTPFAVINGDDFYGPQSFQLIADFFSRSDCGRPDRHHYGMVAYRLDRTLSPHGSVNRGICVGREGYLESVEEHLGIVADGEGGCHALGPDGKRVDIPGRALASMNFWGFTPAIFDQIRVLFRQFLEEHGHTQNAECYIPSVVDRLVRDGVADCRILPTQDPWFGVTHSLDRDPARQALAALIHSGVYPTPLWPSVSRREAH